MTLREGRAELAEYLRTRTVSHVSGKLVERVDVDLERLREAAKALLSCPHVGCAYCWQFDPKEPR